MIIRVSNIRPWNVSYLHVLFAHLPCLPCLHTKLWIKYIGSCYVVVYKLYTCSTRLSCRLTKKSLSSWHPPYVYMIRTCSISESKSQLFVWIIPYRPLFIIALNYEVAHTHLQHNILSHPQAVSLPHWSHHRFRHCSSSQHSGCNLPVHLGVFAFN